MFKVWLIEDDATLREEIRLGLLKWDYDVKVLNDFDNIMQSYLRVEPHIILMDINIPNRDGFYWCNKIRQISKVPVIFISSRDSNMDVIMGVNMGGDDYIQKPFDIELLRVKILALLRRTYDYQEEKSSIIECQGALVNLEKGQLTYKDECVDLTKNEIKILSILMKNKANIVSRDIIMRDLWQHESFVSENTLTVNINRLRAKLHGVGLDNFIETKKGQGYMVK